MVAKRKKISMIAGVFIVMIVTAAITFAIIFDVNTYKPGIETAASAATSLDVRINGKMGLSLFPLGVSADDIRVSNKGVEILSTKTVKIGLALTSLLKNQLKATSCELDKPVINIVKDAEGKYNVENPPKKSTPEKPGKAFHLKEFRLLHGTLVYLDQKTGDKTECKDINLAVNNLVIRDTAKNILQTVAFTGNLGCKEVQKNNLKINTIKSHVQAAKGIIRLAPLTMDIFDAKGKGDITVDQSNVDIVYKINLMISKLDLAQLEKSFGMEQMIGGNADLTVSLTTKANERVDMVSSMDGTVALQGDNLVIYIIDFDEVLSSYATNQKFNLVDLAAFFITGPLGTLGLKWYRYSDLYHETRGKQSVITHFISQWKIKDGIADIVDCALATRHNRIALNGNLNLVSERYDNVIVALLDDKGCAKFKQSISGPLDSPEIGSVSVVESLGEPIFNLYRKTKSLVQGGNCEIFYKGFVQQPGNDSK